MKKPSPTMYVVVFAATAICTTSIFKLLLINHLGEENFREGAPIFIIAIAIFLLALFWFTIRNKNDIEKLVKERDYGAIRRLIIGVRNKRPSETKD